jgi:sec-independent protein translocase protein TatC
MLKKMGGWIGSIKRYFNEIQKDVTDMKNTAEDEISVDKKYSNNNKDKKKMNDETKSQGSFVEHFTELRSRLVKSIIYLFIFFIICYFFAENIYRFLVEPYADAVRGDDLNRRLIFTALHETFITYLKVAFFTSLFVTSPIILTQIWKFIAPGLYKNEKKALLPYLVATPTLFLMGGLLVYYLVMPLAIKFFLSFETVAEINSLPIQLEAKVNEYLSLIMRLIFAFGISFQLPVLLSLLARVGFIDSEYLKKRRKYVIVIIFAVAAILTPPDPITQIGLGIPLLILYELSILSVKIIEKKRKDA